MALFTTVILILSIICLVVFLYIKLIKNNKRKVTFGTMMISLLLLSICAYCIMLIDTNPLINEVNNVSLGNISREETRGFPIDRYNIRRRYDVEVLNAEVSIIRLFTIHNFREGYIWVRYTNKSENVEGLRMGSHRVLAKWRIIKDNGKWSIVEIFEKP